MRDGGEPPALLDVGRVARPHGLRGEVVVDLWTDQEDRLAPGSVLATGNGALEVVAARPHQGRHLVQFANVVDRAAADALRGTVLRAEARDREGVLWVHELVGAEVATERGQVLGRVVAVEANPASDLLVLEAGGLVPLRFVTGHEPGVRVTVDVPEGLVEVPEDHGTGPAGPGRG